MATTLREGVDIVNKALSDLGYTYQIDTTSNETMTEGLQAVGAYAPSQKNLIMEQMNLVLQQRNYGVMFDAESNKFREFLVDMSENGFGIEDIFHELLDGTKTLWDGNATAEEIAKDLVEYKEGDIAKFFHTKANSRKFDATIDNRNYEKVFTPYGVTRYIDTRLANLSWSAEYWFMQRAVDIIKTMVEDDKVVLHGNHSVNNTEAINNTVESIKSITGGFKTPTKLYNKGYRDSVGSYIPVVNMTRNDSDIFIICTPEFMSRLKVYGYSNAFNLSQYELEGRILYAPAGTDLGTASNGEKALAVVVDRRAIVLGIKRWLATTFFVANTGWINHFLNVEILEGYNTIFNAVAITGEAIDDFFNQIDTQVFITAPPSFNADLITTDGIKQNSFETADNSLITYNNSSYIEIFVSELYDEGVARVALVVDNMTIFDVSTDTADKFTQRIELVDGKIYKLLFE